MLRKRGRQKENQFFSLMFIHRLHTTPRYVSKYRGKCTNTTYGPYLTSTLVQHSISLKTSPLPPEVYGHMEKLNCDTFQIQDKHLMCVFSMSPILIQHVSSPFSKMGIYLFTSGQRRILVQMSTSKLSLQSQLHTWQQRLEGNCSTPPKQPNKINPTPKAQPITFSQEKDEQVDIRQKTTQQIQTTYSSSTIRFNLTVSCILCRAYREGF